MSAFPHLETARVRLRELVEADAQAILEIHGDAESMRLYGTDPLEDIEAALRLISKFASWRELPNPGVRWGLEEKASCRLIGTCGVFSWNREWRKAAIGYELAAERRGNGLMIESLSAALNWAFAEMNLNRVEAQIHPENYPSLKLAERLGFQVEGRLRQVAHWGGSFRDLLQYSLLRAEWRNSAT